MCINIILIYKKYIRKLRKFPSLLCIVVYSECSIRVRAKVYTLNLFFAEIKIISS